MIKAIGSDGLGRPVLLLGLSGENVTRLVAGEHISISAENMAAFGLPPMRIVIHYGRTEQDIVAELRRLGVTAPLVADEMAGEGAGPVVPVDQAGPGPAGPQTGEPSGE